MANKVNPISALLTMNTGTTPSNYWDQMVVVASTVALAVSAFGGISSLTQDANCDTLVDVKTCCGNERPPPLIPVLGLVAAFTMPAFLLVSRIGVAPRFFSFRANMHKMAAKAYGTEAERHAAVRTAVSMQAAVVTKRRNPFEQRSGVTKARSRVVPTVQSLAITGFCQALVAVGLVVSVFMLLHRDVLGTAVTVGGVNGRVGNYYKFACDSCANVSIVCHVARESVGLWWTLLIALLVNLVGAVSFFLFAWDLAGPGSMSRFGIVMSMRTGYARFHTAPVYALWRFVQGDRRSLNLDLFMAMVFSTLAATDSTIEFRRSVPDEAGGEEDDASHGEHDVVGQTDQTRLVQHRGDDDADAATDRVDAAAAAAAAAPSAAPTAAPQEEPHGDIEATTSSKT
jgi:hypothetical protein